MANDASTSNLQCGAGLWLQISPVPGLASAGGGAGTTAAMTASGRNSGSALPSSNGLKGSTGVGSAKEAALQAPRDGHRSSCGGLGPPNCRSTSA
jgi:hypothetical protein